MVVDNASSRLSSIIDLTLYSKKSRERIIRFLHNIYWYYSASYFIKFGQIIHKTIRKKKLFRILKYISEIREYLVYISYLRT